MFPPGPLGRVSASSAFFSGVAPILPRHDEKHNAPHEEEDAPQAEAEAGVEAEAGKTPEKDVAPTGDEAQLPEEAEGYPEKAAERDAVGEADVLK